MPDQNETKPRKDLVLEYYTRVHEIIDRIVGTQMSGINKAAGILAETIRKDGLIHAFGSGHSHMAAEEMYSRAGGLAAVRPMLESNLMLHEGTMKSGAMERLPGYAAVLLSHARPGPKDSLIIISNSGRNAVPIEMAMEAKKYGLRPIAITSLDYSRSVVSRHASAKRLFEVADVVIDNCGVAGDAVVEVEGHEAAVAPASTIGSCFIVNSIVARVAEILSAEGVAPPVFVSGNRDGGELHNLQLLQKYYNRIRF